MGLLNCVYGNGILCVWEETTIIIVYIYVVAPLSASYNGYIPPAPYLKKICVYSVGLVCV